MSPEGRLGPRKLRRLEGLVGERLLFAVALDHWTWEAVTLDDRHLLYDKADGTVRERDGVWFHYTSCPTRTPPVEATHRLPVWDPSALITIRDPAACERETEQGEINDVERNSSE